MGSLCAGQHSTLKTFQENGFMPLLSYILIDVDEVRHLLPEFKTYIEESPHCADALSRKEAGNICEITEAEAMKAGKNVIINCSPLKSNWYSKEISRIRRQHPKYKIAIIHITAPLEKVLNNAKENSTKTGLTVPSNLVKSMVQKIPEIFTQLKPNVDYCCEISNDEKVKILPDDDWNTFESMWMQSPKHATKCSSRRLQKRASIAALNAAPPLRIQSHRQFSSKFSTEKNYEADTTEFYGPYARIRATLDYNYHGNYTKQRQYLQDRIVSEFMGQIIIQDKNGDLCTTATEPFIVFTAGAMGAGKGHTINRLVELGYFPLLAFVSVDPDEIRRHFPEYHVYIEECPEQAGELTRKEAGFVAEILTAVAMEQKKNVMVDGSLRDSDWYQVYFQQLRETYPISKLAIIHVVAPKDTIFRRAEERGHRTGRIVPKATLIEAMEQVPKSVDILKHLVDVFVEINNPSDSDIQITSDKDMGWTNFRSIWMQTCAFVPKQSRMKKLTSMYF